MYFLKKNHKIIIIFVALLSFIALGLFFYLQNKKNLIATPAPSPMVSEIRLPKPPFNETKLKFPEFVAPILTYHHIGDGDSSSGYYVTAKNFEEQLDWLNNKGYHFISYDKLYEAMANGGTLPKKPVVISFDDGVTDQYTTALPILEKYQVPAVFFIEVRNVGTDVGITWDQVRDLESRGMTIGSHSMSHANLKNLDAKGVKYELEESKKVLEEHLSKKVNFFSYPKGGFDDAIVEATKDAGYLSAVTTHESTTQKINSPDDLFKVSRMMARNSIKGIFEN